MNDPYGRYPKTGPVCVECQQIVRAVNTKGLCRDCQPKKPKKGKRGSRAATRMPQDAKQRLTYKSKSCIMALTAL